MKKAIITGPTGAVGTALAELLIQRNYEVFAICRPNSPNISNLKPNHNLHVIECDISKLLTLKDKLDLGFDVFYHLAWGGTFGESRNASSLQLDNIKYTMDAVELASGLGCKTFIGAGSQAEYGHFTKAADENTLTKPFSLYGAAKLSAGNLSRVLANDLGIRHIWTRIFSVYGPNDDERTLVSYVINEIKNNKQPALTKGEQVWDYLFNFDAANALIKLSEKGKNGETYNIASGENKLLKEYINDIAKIINPSLKLSFGQKPYGENQVMFLSADITKLKNDTGFVPEYSFEAGIRKILELQNEGNGFEN
ncbi:MAG: GDP-6-deoxy-D-mannose reductase [Eubacteriales bacterium SKADARSKE-1]|nr:GDP-6-deoxy-D-mannose reductase [Eubacteriales bacterium SKADARSKE-1]